MVDAGLEIRRDSFGSVIARLPGSDAGRPTLMFGSHLDTVPDGGRYDGALGVLLPIALCANLAPRQLPFAIEIVAFLAEEGTRFGTGCLSSRAFVGALPRDALTKRDRAGVCLAEALQIHAGTPDRVGQASRDLAEVLGFIEVHIEQASVLESRGVPVGIVQGIVGQSRLSLRVVGQSGHAGTTPMHTRMDALAAAAGVIVEVECLGRRRPGLIATVGRLDVQPNSSNVIPGVVDLSVDLRHPSDVERRSAVQEVVEFARTLAESRGLRASWRLDGERDAAVCDPDLVAELAHAVESVGCPVSELDSLAGHDAMVMAREVPIAMLFVRSPGGLSHHPDEDIVPEDVAVVARVLERFIEDRARAHGAPRMDGLGARDEELELT